MNILLLAPHPFYQERGTPIAARLLVNALTELGHSVDILTYHEGEDLDLGPSVRITRIDAPPFVKGIRPGFSLKKVICDLRMAPTAMRMAREDSYDIVHAIEESVFMAMSIRRRLNIPYIYDMDSSIPQQLVEKHGWMRHFSPVFRWFEHRAIRQAACVAPMCDAVADIARQAGAKRVVVLRDIPLMDATIKPDEIELPDLTGSGTRFMYIGNLEGYQGIDLLLDSFTRARQQTQDICLTVVGGPTPVMERFQQRAVMAGIGEHVQFTGPLPVDLMSALFDRADVLVSPRTKGVNTPMKIYSYLMSGKAVLATDIPSHTQILNPGTAMLAAPRADAFADAMLRLARDEDLRRQLGEKGKALAEREHTFETFKQHVGEIYEDLSNSASNA